MKKLLIITSITLVAVLAFGLTGFSFPQSQTPHAPATPGTPAMSTLAPGVTPLASVKSADRM